MSPPIVDSIPLPEFAHISSCNETSQDLSYKLEHPFFQIDYTRYIHSLLLYYKPFLNILLLHFIYALHGLFDFQQLDDTLNKEPTNMCICLYVNVCVYIHTYTNVCIYIPQTVTFGVLSWKKGTHRAGWVARGSELGARAGTRSEPAERVGDTRIEAGAQPDGWQGPDAESAGARHRGRRGPTQRAPGERWADTKSAGPRHGERRDTQNSARAPGPDTESAAEQHRERPGPDVESAGPRHKRVAGECGARHQLNYKLHKNPHSAFPSMLKEVQT